MPAVEMQQALIDTASNDGGWPYFAAKAPRIEASCWALLALQRPGVPLSLQPHRESLFRRQNSAGLFVDVPGVPPNLAFNGLAAIYLLDTADATSRDPLGRLLTALVRSYGVQLPPSPELSQDNSLRGWPWMDATFSWVEPTAWCLLALKKARRKPDALPAGATPSLLDERIAEAETLLVDRACRDGGWNFGNSRAFGQDMRPFVATTALTLLALQDRRESPAVERGVAMLQRAAESESSGLALALSSICLDVLGLPRAAVRDRLFGQWRTTRFLENVHAAAVGLYAVGSEDHRALRL
jgi:hypothetical protein